MLSFAVLFVFACIAGSFGKPVADENRCHTPDQLHGRIILLSEHTGYLEMNFQSDNQQKAQRYVSHNYKFKFDSLLLYETGIQYTMYEGKCYTNPIGHEFEPLAVPDEATLMGEGELAGEMDVQEYGFHSDNASGIIYLAKESCTPSHVISEVAGYGSLATFLDTAVGVASDAFTIPAACASAGGNVRRSPHPKVTLLRRGMGWEVPNNKRGPWLKL